MSINQSYISDEIDTSSTTFQLHPCTPLAYINIAKIFSSLEFALQSMSRFHQIPSFENVKKSVESSTGQGFTVTQLEEILGVMPDAFEVTWICQTDLYKNGAMRDQFKCMDQVAGENKYTMHIRKNAVDINKSIKERVDKFNSLINNIVTDGVAEILKQNSSYSNEMIKNLLSKVQLFRIPIPKNTLLGKRSILDIDKEKHTIEKEKENAPEVKEMASEYLNKPVSKKLKGLPHKLLEKVRLKEFYRCNIRDSNEKSSEDVSLVSTLPSLMSQLEQYMKFSGKNVFSLKELQDNLSRLPYKKRLEEHLDLLSRKCNLWLSIIKTDQGNRYRINNTKEATISARQKLKEKRKVSDFQK